VDVAMMEAAQQRGVVEAGLAAVRPVLDVMSLQEHAIGASRIRARMIAPVQRPPERAGDRAALATHRQRCAVLVLDDLHHPGITAQPARGLATQK
jgi:hypothetical protein